MYCKYQRLLKALPVQRNQALENSSNRWVIMLKISSFYNEYCVIWRDFRNFQISKTYSTYRIYHDTRVLHLGEAEVTDHDSKLYPRYFHYFFFAFQFSQETEILKRNENYHHYLCKHYKLTALLVRRNQAFRRRWPWYPSPPSWRGRNHWSWFCCPRRDCSIKGSLV